MKKILTCCVLAAILLAAAGCGKEENPETVKERITMTFTAEYDGQFTRTAIDGNMKVIWSENERISIFDGTNNNIFSLQEGAGTVSGTFLGAAIPDEQYAALYPYSDKAGYASGKISAELPSEQTTSSDDSFATMLNPAVAMADGNGKLTFRNVAGLLEISVENIEEGMSVSSIEVRADKSLTGPYTVDMSAGTWSAVPSDQERLYSAGLTRSGSAADDGNVFRIVVLPGEYSEMTFTTVLTDGTYFEHVKTTANNISIEANKCISQTIDATETIFGLPESDVFQDFVDGNRNNILLDFSYAGYDHGESAPEEVFVTKGADGKYTASNGYKVYNIEDYGGNGNDDISDRQAFLDMLEDIFGAPEIRGNLKTQITFPDKASAKAVLYFPEGNFILHTADDDLVSAGQRLSYTILVRSGDIIMKGAGKDKTVITMDDPNQPDDPDVLYSSPDMIQFKHNTGIQAGTVLGTVTEDSPKGSYSVTAGGLNGISSGDWVCLYLKNSSPEVVAEELSPYQADASWVMANNYGVSVQDLHQVKSVSGNKVTFYEPIMHEIDADWGWKIVRYSHYANVGVEDLTFAGHAEEEFVHHASWHDDGAYKPVSMNRLVNSWIRRVDFTSVSEACSIINCANVSVYNVNIEGNRGHAAIRSQGSSRVFIGACADNAQGIDLDDSGKRLIGTQIVHTGQYHTFGISKESMGAVLWRIRWGTDTNFECHATQPRATLIDCCEGGWEILRAGGDAVQMPNHLDDLTIWNFNATSTTHTGTWIWWDYDSKFWKFLPPTIVGFHGAEVVFDKSQVKADIGHGTPANPESLYEAQLQNRLGYVPGWLTALKGTAASD